MIAITVTATIITYVFYTLLASNIANADGSVRSFCDPWPSEISSSSTRTQNIRRSTDLLLSDRPLLMTLSHGLQPSA